MIARTSTTIPSDMLTSAFYNGAIYVGSGGYYKGNKNYQCVNYAIGRTCELANRPVTYYRGITNIDIPDTMFNRSGYGNACEWLNDTLWEVGNEPRLGAIMVYGTAWGSGLGHVRVVEKISGDKIFYSAANENKKMAFKWIDKPSISKTGFMGYIYNPYVKEEDMDLIKIIKDKNYDWKWSVDGNKYGEAYDITTEGGFSDEALVKEGWELVLKVNGSLFYTYDNKHYACGIEKSRGVNNQDVNMSAVSDYNDCMSIMGVSDELYFGRQNWLISNLLEQAYCGITGLGLILSNAKRNDLHKGFESQWKAISGRTVIGEDVEGNFLSYSFAGETGKSGMTCEQLQDKCLELGFVNAICLDGGGSVFRQYRNEEDKLVYDISTTRKVKNALLLYRKKKDTTPTPSDDEANSTPLEKYNELKAAYDKVLATYIPPEKYEELSNEYDSVVDKLNAIGDIINE